MNETGERRTGGPPAGLRGFVATLGEDWRSVWSRPEDRLAAKVLITSVLLLIVYALWGRPFFINANLPAVAAWLGLDADHEYYSTVPYMYWGVSSLVIRILLPLLVIVVWIGGRPSDFGYRLRGVTSHAWLYLLMFLVMLPLLVARATCPPSRPSTRCTPAPP